MHDLLPPYGQVGYNWPRFVAYGHIGPHCPAPVVRPPIGTKDTRITFIFEDVNLSILHRNEPVVVLLRHRLHALWGRLGQLLDEPPCKSHA